MAAPPEVTMQNLTGSWTMSKNLSDCIDPALALQGVPWILRKLIGLTTLSMYITQVIDDAGLKTLTFDQSASITIGGLKAETEIRVLDWREEHHISMIFGTTSHRSKFIQIKACLDPNGKLLHPFLTEDILDEEDVGEGGNLYDIAVNSVNGWVIQQLWGFEMINGERWLVRKMLVTKGKEEVAIRARYEWKGKTKNG